MNVTDGKRVDWSAKGVPAHIEVYELPSCVALYDRAKDKHVAMNLPLSWWSLGVGLRQIEAA